MKGVKVLLRRNKLKTMDYLTVQTNKHGKSRNGL
jgi:hypothetical protein